MDYSMFQRAFSVPLSNAEVSKRLKKVIRTIKNQEAFMATLLRLVQDGLQRYDIECLPETVSKRVVLESLFWYGCVCFFEMDGGIVAFPAAPGGDFSRYGDPGTAYVFSRFSSDGFNKQVPLCIPCGAYIRRLYTPEANKGVLVWDNKIRVPFAFFTLYFAEKIADTMRTLDVCRSNLKNPLLFAVEESLVPTVKKYLEERDENAAAVIGSGVLDPSKIQTIITPTSSDTLTACTALIEWYENRHRELCGIKNAMNMDKKGENLIESEISVNDEYTSLSVPKSLEAVQEGLDFVNEMFGTNIKAVKREEMKKDDTMQTTRTEDFSGVQDGKP